MAKILGLMIGLITCFAAYAGGPEYISTQPTSGGFNKIYVDGYVNVLLRSATQSSVTVAGAAFNPVHTHVSNHTLYIQTPWWPATQLTKRPLVTVNIPELNRLIVNGQANVAGNLQSHHLSIAAHGLGKIKLTGMLQVDSINQTGSNRIYLRWVNSPILLINSAGNGFIYLGGIANTLYARVYDHAVLNAQYLRTQTVQVQTKNYASAFVYPVTTLRAFANNNTNIYYYAYPQNMTRDTKQSGNVLQMAWRP